MIFGKGKDRPVRLTTSGKTILSVLLSFFVLTLPTAAQSVKHSPRKGTTKSRRPATPAKKPQAAPAQQVATNASTQALMPVKYLLEQNRLVEARRAVDDLLNNPRNQRMAEAWYLKARIYAGIVSDARTQALLPDGRRQALDAIRKAMEVDRNQALLLLTVEAHQTAFSLYTSGLRQGVDLYNTQRYEPALNAFHETALTGEYIFSQGWGLSRIDTSLTLYTGLAAYRAGRQDEAMLQFRKLADAEISGGPEFASAYRYLAKYCYDRKDAANLARYLTTGMILFPGDEYLMLTDIEVSRDSRDYRSLFEKYERFLSVFPNRYDAMMEYANELFGHTHVAGNARTKADYASNCARLEELFNRSVKLRPESDEAWLSLGKHYYNQALVYYEESSRNTGKSSEDRQLKLQLDQQTSMLADKAIQPLETVFRRLDGRNGLTDPESSYYQSACSLLSYCYELKKDFAKSDLYKNKFETTRQHRIP